MELKYTDNVMDWTRKLRRAGFAMQEAGAEACTMAAQYVASQYRLALRTKTIQMRNETFTMKAIVVYPAKAKHGSGELRKMENINAIVGVRKNGNKEHYLAMLEIGASKKGIPQLGGAVPIPLDSARQGESRAAVVAGAQRLVTGRYQYGGAVDLSKFCGNPRQQFAIMNSMARRGKLWITGQKNKQIGKHAFYVVDHGDHKWLYKITGKKATIVRDLDYDTVKIKAKPFFEESIDRLNQTDMETYFVRAAMILLGSLE